MRPAAPTCGRCEARLAQQTADTDLSDFNETAAPILLHVQIEALVLDLQHFRGQFLLPGLGHLTCGMEGRIRGWDRSGLVPVRESGDEAVRENGASDEPLRRART